MQAVHELAVVEIQVEHPVKQAIKKLKKLN